MTTNKTAPGTAFPGVLGRTIAESERAWPALGRAKHAAPNVLVIVLDDTGFGHLGCYGAPIHTPHLDLLAARGLLFNNMHATALSSPNRACILTGRNPHPSSVACITEGETSYPGSYGHIPFENGFLSEILLTHGYSTFALGKWHLTPLQQVSAAGPFDRWPLGRGFERFYGFLGADTHQYYPDLVSDNHQVAPPRGPEQGYHLTEDLVDRAIGMIADTKQVAPQKPFFMYFCTGAMHAPHHAPIDWVEQYAGKFDGGWDAYREQTFKRQQLLGVLPQGTHLSVRDPDVPVWKTLPASERRVYARMMEVFAGSLEHTDHQIGRLLHFLEATNQADNTLVMVTSDHGAKIENGWGWAWAGSAPFRRWKQEAFRGGVSDPFIVSWPDRIEFLGLRSQYAHVIDIVPTVLDALDLAAPTLVRGVVQSPIEGVSFAHVFDDPDAPSRHQSQYFEMFGHRAIYHDGWRAVCPVSRALATAEDLRALDVTGWELYHVAKDFAETKNLAAQNRPKLNELIAMWYAEAGRFSAENRRSYFGHSITATLPSSLIG